MITIAEKEFSSTLVTNREQFDRLLDKLSRWSLIALDTETTGLNSFLGDKLAGIAIFIPDENEAFYLSFRHALGDNLPIEWMQILFESLYGKTLETWNGKFDLHFLYADGFDPYKIELNEGMIALHLLDENRKDQGLNYRLKDVGKQFIDGNADRSDIELKEKLAKIGLKKGQMFQLPANEVAEYAMTDTILTHLIIEFLKPYMDKWLVTNLWHELNEYTLVIWRFENAGMLIDRDLCRTSINDMEIQAKDRLQRIQELAGYNLNPNSPAQVKSWLKTKDATKQTLAALEETDERARLIQEYRFYSKAASTFYLPYLKYSEGDGKVHTTIHVTGTTTGRPSFSDPNLGQVPRKGKYEVKRVFIAPDGYYIVQADYAQQELRLAAHYTNETALIDAFNNGIDPHQQTADHVGITRNEAKNYNFATIYGAGARKLAWMTGDTEENARKNLERFDELYPNLRQFAWAYSDTAKLPRNPDGSIGGKYHFVRLPDGRCRHYNGTDAPYYSAFNTLIQGTGAIIMRRALMSICNHFPPDLDVMIPVQTVYDSFICYVRKEYLDEVCTYIKMFMEDFPEYNPPMVVDIEYGENWLELTKWQKE